MTFTTSNTGRCRTCKWWRTHGQEAGKCLRTEEPNHGMHPVPPWRHVYTMADFGCVQWARRHEEAGE